jgi:hypothetical protein
LLKKPKRLISVTVNSGNGMLGNRKNDDLRTHGKIRTEELIKWSNKRYGMKIETTYFVVFEVFQGQLFHLRIEVL